MKFRLTYEGVLRSSNKGGLSGHKHDIRKEFHKQLKHLWETNPFLSTYKVHEGYFTWNETLGNIGQIPGHIPLLEEATKHYSGSDAPGYTYVPLAAKVFMLQCNLHILFLRAEGYSGKIIQSGDIDNRIKTLLDTLHPPTNEDSPDDIDQGLEPFFCLLEDDSQITGFSVETDRLLDPKSDDPKYVSVIMTVELLPFKPTNINMYF